MLRRWPVARRLSGARVATTGRLGRGQSLVEFALIVPILLLIVMGGIDFGRVFLGWVALNNTARVAANYAGSNALLLSAGNTAALASYNTLVQDDAEATNCTPPNPIPAPVYSPSASIGGTAQVGLTCTFRILTPVVSQVLGGTVQVSASSTFPVRVGVVANVPGGGGPAPVAGFTLSPSSGDAPLPVTLTDTSTGGPSSWEWDFGNGQTYSGQNPPSITYSTAGTFTITLTVSNGLSSTSATRIVTVTLPPGPVAGFTANPTSGTSPLIVSFTDSSTGTIAIWEWDFGDGDTFTGETPPAQTYNTGTWTATLVVTDDVGLSSTFTQTITVADPNPTCQVPNFKNDTTSDSTIAKWTAAGFDATKILFNPLRPPEFKVTKQSLAAGSDWPCTGTTITVFDK
jgi:PKD repeat protein